MKTQSTILVCLLLAATVASGADWVYDNGVVTDGVWTFNAQLSGTKVTLTGLTGGPSAVTALDFSKPIRDTSDNVLSFTYFGRFMDNATGQAFRPYVGALTLPASGYTGIGRNAFSFCPNATGTISFPAELTSLEGGSAFWGSTGITIVGDSFPEGLKVISGNAFRQCIIDGDVVLTDVETIQQGSFAETAIQTVVFGPNLTKMENYSGSGANGAFQNCTSLENVYFDPASSVTITHGWLFYGCTSLQEIDLSAVVHIEQNGDNLSHFYNCSSLKKVTFGSRLEYLDGRIFNHAPALSQVFFEGPPPATIANTYLLGAGNGGEVTTYVVLDPYATGYDYASAKAAWDALTAGGEINAVDSTWKADYIGDAPASTRHLLLFDIAHVSIAAARDADEGEGVVGIFTVSRAETDSTAADLVVDYTVGGTAVAGRTYGALSGSVTIPAGETSATIEVVPLDDPLTTSNATVVVTLADGEYDIAAGRRTATVNVMNGASFPGWKYAIAGSGSGTMSKGGWSFAATHSGRSLTVGAVTAWPDEISGLDFSAIVAGSDGHVYTIVNLNPTGLGGANACTEPGSRVGHLVLPGEGLEKIGISWAFANCTNAYGALVFPSTVTTIGGGAFAKTPIEGDLHLPSLKILDTATFWNTKITSATFGPALTKIPGAASRGPFAGCTCLTNVVFDPDSKVILDAYGATFLGCTALTDLDLSCVTNIAWKNAVYPRFQNCTALTNITFGTELRELPADVFKGASALQTVHFKGPAPVIVGDGKLFAGINANQTVKSYVFRRNSEKGTFGPSWIGYSANGKLDTTTSRWRNDLLDSGDNARFYLLLEDAPPPIVIVIK